MTTFSVLKEQPNQILLLSVTIPNYLMNPDKILKVNLAEEKFLVG